MENEKKENLYMLQTAAKINHRCNNNIVSMSNAQYGHNGLSTSDKKKSSHLPMALI